MLLSPWLYVTDGVRISVCGNLWGYISFTLWFKEISKSRYEKTKPKYTLNIIGRLMFAALCLITMVLETFSQSVIPGILQKLIFKQNESTVEFPGQTNAEVKSVELEDIEAETIRKSDRKKVKKRRRREKRKFIESSHDIDQLKDSELTHSEDNTMDSEEEFLDLNSAFVALAVSRKKIHNPNLDIDGGQCGVKEKSSKIQDEETETKYTVTSERLAIQGCRLAAKEHHERAIDMFTKAIELTPGDYRFYGNRSFCYCQLGQYKRALKDADKAITLAPGNPKGYFRKGEALKALNKLKEAKESFQHVLKLDEDCEDARMELRIVGELLEMASKDNMPLNFQVGNRTCGRSLISSGETSSHGDVLHNSRVDSKMDPSNPDGSCSLWIGNISAAVTEQQLMDMFSEYGFVCSVRILQKKFCAFVNFQEATSAGMAMKYLQRSVLCGERILIRFPDNPSLILPKTSPCNSLSSSPSPMYNANHRSKENNGRNWNPK